MNKPVFLVSVLLGIAAALASCARDAADSDGTETGSQLDAGVRGDATFGASGDDGGRTSSDGAPAGTAGNSDSGTDGPVGSSSSEDGGDAASGYDIRFGDAGYGGGLVANAPCSGNVNAAGSVYNWTWPASSNIGPNIAEGGSVHFTWTGSHNVLQIATWPDVFTPDPARTDSHWQNEIYSGAATSNGSYDWNLGSFPCGYRPGIYFFVDQSDTSAIISADFTVEQGAAANEHYASRACSTLNNPSVYGGRYSAFAGRAGCTVYEVNNFQTEAHFDWVPPTFSVNQGDLLLFRWTGKHNVVQVHDVTQDSLVPGGITSGEKSQCVAGPNYSCVNGPPTLGEYMVDTENYRPGYIHISDACAETCTGHSTGMNMEFLMHFEKPATPDSCCSIHDGKKRKTSCRIIDTFNSNDGAQFEYQTGAGSQDVVRFRWAGSLKIYQSVPNADGSPSSTAVPGGAGTASPVECVPGPMMTCLNGTTSQAQFLFDVADALTTGLYSSNGGGKFWDFHALGENTAGYTSADTNAIVYLDTGIAYDPNAPDCP